MSRVAPFRSRAPADERTGAARLRRGFAALVFVYVLVLSVRTSVHGEFVSPVAVLMMLMALALFFNRGGRAMRDWGLVFLAFVSYAAAANVVPDLGLKVHYTPQIEAERLLAFGSLPTNWLQSHLYDGTTGALEVFSIVMYMSHFLAPIVLASLIWLYWPGRAFRDLFFGILAVTFLGDITFLIAPTAPPWLAGDQGLIPEVHHVIKQGLGDLGLTWLAERKDDPASYNVVAAIPSLHAAWPIIGVLVILKHRLPGWLLWAQVALLGGVVFSIVYTGEHYLIDAVVGALYALAAWWLYQRVVKPGRDERAALEPRPSPSAYPLPAVPLLAEETSRDEDR